MSTAPWPAWIDALDPEERRAVRERLDALDEAHAWADELHRRAAAVRDGTAPLLPADAVLTAIADETTAER